MEGGRVGRTMNLSPHLDHNCPGPDGFSGEFCHTFKESIVLKLSPKSEKGTLSDSFYKASINLIPKPDKDTTRKKILMNINANPQQNTSNTKFSSIAKGLYTMTPNEIYFWNARMV